MPAWNFVLQLVGPSGGRSICDRFSLPGLAQPCRVTILACDGNASPAAAAAHAAMKQELQAKCGTHASDCGGPGLWGCMALDEASCRQILVPVIGQTLEAAAVDVIRQWPGRPDRLSTILPALMGGLTHGQAFAGSPPELSRLASIGWGSDPRRLAALAMQQATQSTRPGVFLSYRRDDAGRIADQLFDGLAHRGYRVFVDRFCGSAGRYFPHELAEEMADKAVIVVLESPRIMGSAWTLWEIRFARRYRLGLVSLRLAGAPRLSGIAARQDIAPDSSGQLPANDLDRVLDFIGREHVAANLRRRAFYEALVSSAAASRGGSIHSAGSGLLELRDRTGAAKALLLPAGRPGQVTDVRSMDTSGTTTHSRLLIGQHRHLPPASRDDLNWLSRMTHIDLAGRWDSYRRVQSLC